MGETQKYGSADTADGLKPQVISYKFTEVRNYKWEEIYRLI